MITGSVPGTELCTAVGPETSIMGCALRVRVLHDHRFGTGGRVMCCCGAGRVDQHIPCPRRQSSGGQVGEMPGHEVIVGPVSSRARGCHREPGAGSRADAVPDHGPPNSRARRLPSGEWIKPDAAPAAMPRGDIRHVWRRVVRRMDLRGWLSSAAVRPGRLVAVSPGFAYAAPCGDRPTTRRGRSARLRPESVQFMRAAVAARRGAAPAAQRGEGGGGGPGRARNRGSGRLRAAQGS